MATKTAASPATDMPYREQAAWLTLVAMLVAYTVYFAVVLTRPELPSLLDTLWLFAGVTVPQMIAVMAGHAVLATRGHTPADERDRAIARRGGTVGYYVLLAGILYTGVVLPFGYSGAVLVDAALLAVVASETVRLGMIIVSYRRSWHG